MKSIESIIKQKILILDGAIGTLIQRYDLQEEDFRGEVFKNSNLLLKGDNDLLCITRPDIIEDIHRKYLDAGADIIETNTFNAQRISQEDYHCEDFCCQINMVACAIARKVADEYTQKTPDKPRFVAGSIGPTNKTCSISTDVNRPEWRAVTFDELVAAYREQIEVMLQGGVDVLLIETIFDTLNAKAALFAVEGAQRTLGTKVPVMLSVTIADKGGHTLSGQNLQAFLTSIEHAKIFSVGLNCSFGPAEMKPFLEELASIAPYYVSVYPNAGLPNVMGEYDITADKMASLMKQYVDENLVNIIGGCCGTTDEYIAKYANLIKIDGQWIKPRVPAKRLQNLQLSGLERLEVRPENNFVNIGERCNVAGSRKFLRLIGVHQYEEAMAIARQQVEDGAQVIDINMDDGLLDAKEEMVTFINLLASDPNVSRVPLMIDSSNWEVILAALKCTQGKSIVNSISLKEGEKVFLERAEMIRRLGAAVIVMAFDEKGQACTYEKKIQVCERAYRLLTEKLDYNPNDIIFDPNVLSIATGMHEHDAYAKNFILATEWIRKNLPYAHVSGGVSNLSFSFRGNNYIREAMHAVFLYYAIEKGMDMGIVNPASRVMYDDIPVRLRTLLEDVVLNRREDSADRLLHAIDEMKSQGQEVTNVNVVETADSWKSKSIDERLKTALIKGNEEHLEDDLKEAMESYGRAVKIIEGPLMDGMGIVGKNFASGKMFLPQVVRTAKTMQKAVSILSPFMIKEKENAMSSTGKILMATVKGDVHDIGKNIVGVVLACNNFSIEDLGVMCPAEKIVEIAKEKNVDLIGLCGLITPSLTEMINTAKALNEAGISVPLLIGGATTSKLHTALKIAPVYKGPVIWAKDAAQCSIVAANIMSSEKRDAFLMEVANEYKKLRETQQGDRKLSTLEDIRKNKLNLFDSNY